MRVIIAMRITFEATECCVVYITSQEIISESSTVFRATREFWSYLDIISIHVI